MQEKLEKIISSHSVLRKSLRKEYKLNFPETDGCWILEEFFNDYKQKSGWRDKLDIREQIDWSNTCRNAAMWKGVPW